MVRRRVAGYTLLEVVVAMAIFGIFLIVLGVLTSEFRTQEKRYPVNFMRHPQISTVVERMRRDILDGFGTDPFLEEHGGFTAGDKVLIIETVLLTGREQIVWDLRTPGEVARHSFRAGVRTSWRTRGLPREFSSSVMIDAFEFEGEDGEPSPISNKQRAYGVRIRARDEEGRIAVDQIFQPRANE